ncbi:MAG: hypothetical protein ACRCXC_00640 [Legionella sp.]
MLDAKRMLPVYLGIIFLLTLMGSCQAYLTHSTWHIGDWLINYQGGFVRRGFLGELIYQLTLLTHISPGFYAFLAQTVCNGLFFIFSYCLLTRQPRLLPFALLSFSPFVFNFQINSFDQVESQGGYFKESIYCAILAFTGWAACVYSVRSFAKLFYGILLVYPLVILTHEMFAVFLPFLFMVYLLKVPVQTKRLMWLCALLSMSLLAFILCLIHSGNREQVFAIAQSLTPTYPVSTYGSIGWLMMPMSAAIERVLFQIQYNHYIQNYSLVLLLSLLAFIPVRHQLKRVFENKLSWILFLLP